MKIGIILGDQLFPQKVEADHYLMIESYELCTHYKYHKQKIVFFLSAMRSYAQEIQNITYKQLSKKKYVEILEEVVQEKDVTEIVMYEIEDKFFAKEIMTFCEEKNIILTFENSPGFLTTRKEFVAWKKSNKLFMADFYKFQRRRLNILMDGDKPVGDKWSFDEENRKKLPKNHELPNKPEVELTQHTKEVIELVKKEFSNHPGELENFWLPTTRKQALNWLDTFLDERFELFGDYEDAIEERQSLLYHSALSPLLNCGLLTPKEVVDKALQKDVPINSQEGFIRQIIGWREFVRGCYHTSTYENNHFKHKNKLTKSWYEGTTGIKPVDDAIQKAQKFAYLHHIERLMVVGNCMLLCEIDPQEVNKWFMELFIDSADWVMEPNVFSMSQFSDGGISEGGFATKPYIAGSNYIRKMGNYKKEDWCDVFDGLYWRFIRQNKDTFSRNPRMSMMAKMSENSKHDEKVRLANEFIKKHTYK